VPRIYGGQATRVLGPTRYQASLALQEEGKARLWASMNLISPVPDKNIISCAPASPVGLQAGQRWSACSRYWHATRSRATMIRSVFSQSPDRALVTDIY
jgi:hypothetical protein